MIVDGHRMIVLHLETFWYAFQLSGVSDFWISNVAQFTGYVRQRRWAVSYALKTAAIRDMTISSLRGDRNGCDSFT
jgi:hypothetical protein